MAFDLPHDYATTSRLPLNSWDMSGSWTVARHAAGSNSARSRIRFQFHARDLNLVMGPQTKGAVIPFRVTLDGHAAGDAHGTTWTPTAEGS